MRMIRYINSALLFIYLINPILGIQVCDSSTVVHGQCSATQTCIPTKDLKNGYCDCLPGHYRINTTYCKNIGPLNVTAPPKSLELVKNNIIGQGPILGFLIPVFLVIIISGCYLNHRYNIITFVYNKLHQRNRSYDEVMIGHDIDDDPPLN